MACFHEVDLRVGGRVQVLTPPLEIMTRALSIIRVYFFLVSFHFNLIKIFFLKYKRADHLTKRCSTNLRAINPHLLS